MSLRGLFWGLKNVVPVLKTPQIVFTALYCSERDNEQGNPQFDVRMLEYIVCPLSKSQLRYDAAANELICDELKVAYPIQNGIPNLVPQDARMMTVDKTQQTP